MKSKKWLISLGLAVILVVAFALPACEPAEPLTYAEYVARCEEMDSYPVPEECFDQAMEEGELKIFNWAGWFDAVYAMWEDELGTWIPIQEDALTSADEQVAKFKLNPNLAYDITGVGPKAYMRLLPLDVMQEVNRDWLPNVEAFVYEEYINATFSEEFPYTVPLNIIMGVIGYNKEYVDPEETCLDSWEIAFNAGCGNVTGGNYTGHVTMVDDMFDTIGSALKYLGYSFNSVNETELDEARDLLLAQKPLLLAYESTPRSLIDSGEAWIYHWWLGEVGKLAANDPDTYGIIFPKEGTVMGFEYMLLPIGAQNPAAAHLFFNFFQRPDVYLTFMESYPSGFVNWQAWENVDPSWVAANPWTELDLGYIAVCEATLPESLTGEGLVLRTAIWEELKA